MATLAQQRQTIAQGMAASRAATGGAERQAIGQSLVDERRGAGQRMADERRGIKEDLNALEKSPRKNAQLPQLERRGTRQPAMGVGSWNPNRVPAASGGIASPLVEQPSTRELYDEETLVSIDGLIAFRVRRVKKLHMLDSNNAEVVLEFANVP